MYIDTSKLAAIEPVSPDKYDDLNGDFVVEPGDTAVFYTGALKKKIDVPEGKRLIVTQRVGFRVIDI